MATVNYEKSMDGTELELLRSVKVKNLDGIIDVP